MSTQSSTKTALTVVGGIIGTALIVWPLAVWLEVRKCEKPKYKTLRTIGTLTRSFYDRAPAFEIREYAPYVVAEVVVDGKDMREAMSNGFRQVAGYIFGGNVKDSQIKMTSPVQSELNGQDQLNGENGAKKDGEKIAMTSPVTAEMDGGRYKVAFVMPSKYESKADLPTPKNAKVQLREVPAHTLAAFSWRGWPRPTEEVVKQKESELRKALEGSGIKVETGAKTRLYQYYPPFAPAPIRLQDVLLSVEKPSTEKAKAT